MTGRWTLPAVKHTTAYAISSLLFLFRPQHPLVVTIIFFTLISIGKQTEYKNLS